MNTIDNDISMLKWIYYSSFRKEPFEYDSLNDSKEYLEMIKYCLLNQVEINEEIEKKFFKDLNIKIVRINDNSNDEDKSVIKPRKGLLYFFEDEWEIINECIEEGNYDHPLYIEYKLTKEQSHKDSLEPVKNFDVKKDNIVYSKEELEKELQELLAFDDF